MDLEKLDARWERTVALWKRVKQVGRRVCLYLFIPLMLFLAGCLVYVVWDAIAHPAFRKQLAASEMRQLKWYLIFGVASWLISKIWKKKPEPEETADDEQPSVQSSKQKGRRKNNRRVQRGR